MNHLEMAAALYPSMAQQGQPAEQPAPPSPQGQPAEHVAPASGSATDNPTQEAAPEQVPTSPLVPESIRAMREGDMLRKLYDTQKAYQFELPDSLADELHDVPAESRSAVVAELREMAADLGMEPEDVRAVRALANTPDPDDATRAQWKTEAMARLRDEFGDRSPQVLKDAQTLIARDPRTAQMLGLRGMGDHPELVIRFARLGQKARSQGKL